MKRTYVRLIVSFLLLFPSSPTSFAVIGGTDASANPVVVGLLRSENATSAGCSGALISPRIVFTAAHCLSSQPSDFWISTPGSDLRDTKIKRIQAEKFFIPESFRKNNFPMNNDFGIIVLRGPFELAKNYSFATLGEIEDWTKTQVPVVHVGYGCTSLVEKPPCGKTSATPNQIITTLESKVPTQFKELTLGTFSMTKISVEKSICGGDSGSPLLRELDGRWIYIGAQSSSNGAGCTPTCDLNCVATQGLPAANASLVEQARLYAGELPMVASPTTSDATTKTPGTAPRKSTITCIKGKLTKKVTASKPTCPAGFKKQR